MMLQNTAQHSFYRFIWVVSMSNWLTRVLRLGTCILNTLIMNLINWTFFFSLIFSVFYDPFYISSQHSKLQYLLHNVESMYVFQSGLMTALCRHSPAEVFTQLVHFCNVSFTCVWLSTCGTLNCGLKQLIASKQNMTVDNIFAPFFISGSE